MSLIQKIQEGEKSFDEKFDVTISETALQLSRRVDSKNAYINWDPIKSHHTTHLLSILEEAVREGESKEIDLLDANVHERALFNNGSNVALAPLREAISYLKSKQV